ncbi:transcription elongation factor A N-terminal and central domain-containing protein [Gastrophryne carolinensis]
MLDVRDIKELTHRALEVEKLLAQRKYEDIMDHLSYFETLEVTLQILQQTDVIRVVYMVLKSFSQGTLKKKAKCLLSKWKLLHKESCVHTKGLEDTHGDESNRDNAIVAEVQQISEYEQDIADISTIGALSFTETREQTTDCMNSSPPMVSCEKSSEGQKKVITEELRIKCKELLCQALLEPTECQQKANAYAEQVEECIFNMYPGNDKKYRNCVRSKISNLRNPKNSHLKKLIYSGSLNPKTFAGMTAVEMAGDELQKLRQTYTQASVQEHQLPQSADGLHTNKIKCRRCEKFDCTVTRISRGTLFLPGWVRSGDSDEEMMTFVICNVCGEKWYHNRWICL